MDALHTELSASPYLSLNKALLVGVEILHLTRSLVLQKLEALHF